MLASFLYLPRVHISFRIISYHISLGGVGAEVRKTENANSFCFRGGIDKEVGGGGVSG